MQPIAEYADLDVATARRTVLSQRRPAILRGWVQHWPAVLEARRSASALIQYLARFDSGKPVDAVLTPPEVGGELFYNDTISGFNFVRNRLPLTAVAQQVLRYSLFDSAPAVAAQSALVSECLPGFEHDNPMELVDRGVPRIWLGNRITTPTHLDEWNNIACVVTGRRRFTLFPPEQIGNLYIGPLDFAPTGAAMSLVSLRRPDLNRFPKFRDALVVAQTAELGPGDAIYLPPLWWHHVESMDSFNVLVNYWWHDAAGESTAADSTFDVLLHGILSIRRLSPATRRAWGALFQHYLFDPNSDAVGHIPPERHGILGNLSADQLTQLRTHLAQRLGRPPA